MVFTDNDLARRVIEHSVDGLLVIDAEGIVQFANPAAVSLFASRTHQLTGFHLGAPASHDAVEITLAGGDSVRYVEMRSTEITWEGCQATLAALRDITQRKHAEEALQKQADELRERNGALVSFNRAAVGRELRMIELKQEVNELCAKLGQPPRHRIPGEETGAAGTTGVRL
jgi:PAS domain-containing protein